ncbi:MAG: hypothetical protein JJE30_19160 [Desulfuromonadales bacterium]|nr:hypothetical protein [Desulfuromonadales bacterium]
MVTSSKENARSERTSWTDDFWGGLAAMLVALPSSVAFGIAESLRQTDAELQILEER